MAKRDNVDRALGRLKLRAMFQLNKDLPPASSVAAVVDTFNLLLTQKQREDTFFTGRLYQQYKDTPPRPLRPCVSALLPRHRWWPTQWPSSRARTA